VAGAVHVELAVAAGFEHAVEAALEQAEVEKPWASTRVAASWGRSSRAGAGGGDGGGLGGQHQLVGGLLGAAEAAIHRKVRVMSEA
jgi:hypothetical protein